jgi:hypothetical protein
MSQNDFTIANQTFPSTRSDINSALQALASLSSGTSAPSTTFAGMFWYDTTNGLIKQRNAADSAWVTLWAEDSGGFVAQNGASIYAADAGANDTYAITLSPAPASLTTGMHVFFKANTANTGAATLNVNGLGAVALKKNKDSDLNTNDIKAGDIVLVGYDGTYWVVKSALNDEYDVLNRTAITTLQAADQVPFADNSDSDKTKKITVENFRTSLINDATAETTVNDADTILIYDASATAPRKMTRANFMAGTPYTSPNQTITTSGTLTLSHLLGAIPTRIRLLLYCNSDEHGYVAGEYIDLSASVWGVTINNDRYYGCTCTFDATTIFIQYSSYASVFYVHKKSATVGDFGNITNGNWRLVVVAEV